MIKISAKKWNVIVMCWRVLLFCSAFSTTEPLNVQHRKFRLVAGNYISSLTLVLFLIMKEANSSLKS